MVGGRPSPVLGGSRRVGLHRLPLLTAPARTRCQPLPTIVGTRCGALPPAIRPASFLPFSTHARRVRGLGMEVCTTLGMLTPEQAAQLRDAGLTAYNHNLDTSEGGSMGALKSARGCQGCLKAACAGVHRGGLARPALHPRPAPCYRARHLTSVLLPPSHPSLTHPPTPHTRVLLQGQPDPHLRRPPVHHQGGAGQRRQRVRRRHPGAGRGGRGPRGPPAPGGWVVACHLSMLPLSVRSTWDCRDETRLRWWCCWRCGCRAPAMPAHPPARVRCLALPAPQLATFHMHPESVPINNIVAVKGTPMEDHTAPSGAAPPGTAAC